MRHHGVFGIKVCHTLWHSFLAYFEDISVIKNICPPRPPSPSEVDSPKQTHQFKAEHKYIKTLISIQQLLKGHLFKQVW